MLTDQIHDDPSPLPLLNMIENQLGSLRPAEARADQYAQEALILRVPFSWCRYSASQQLFNLL